MNHQSSVGLTEEALTNLINAVAVEYHLRLTLEKYYSLLYVKQVEDEKERAFLSRKLDSARKILEIATDNRRELMRIIQGLGTSDANPNYWCTLKHNAEQMITAFEMWQVDLNNEQVEHYYHKTVEQFNLVVSEFLGFIPQPCSACLADSMESQEEFNDMMSGLPTPAKDSADGVLKDAEQVFGGKIDEPVLEGHSE